MPDFINPSPKQFSEVMAECGDEPVLMLNPVRLRAVADYDDGRAATGAEAYGIYLKKVAPMLAAVGGRVVWSGRPEAVLIGPDEERWDKGFLVEYPNAAAFQSMLLDPAYREVARHRVAAVETSRLIRFSPESG